MILHAFPDQNSASHRLLSPSISQDIELIIAFHVGKLPSMASGVAISVNIQKSIQSLACRELRVCEGVDPNLIPQAVPITIGKEELERESNVLRCFTSKQ